MSDDIIARYLDGSLSDEERREMERQLAAQPELAAEVRALRHVETMLHKDGARAYAASAEFRRSAKASVRRELGFEHSRKIGLPPLDAPSARGLRSIFGAIGLIALGGIVVLISLLPESSEPAQPLPGSKTPYGDEHPEPAAQYERETAKPALPADTAKHTAAPNLTATPAARGKYTPGRTEQGAEVATQQTPAIPPPAQTPATHQENEKRDLSEIQAELNGNQKLEAQIRNAIQTQTALYAEQKARNNHVAAALTAMKLAALYRQSGQAQQEDATLVSAIEAARIGGLREVEGEALGYRGALKLRAGSPREARELLQQSVDILRAMESPKLDRFEALLKNSR